MKERKSVLGKGLGALLGHAVNKIPNNGENNQIIKVPVGDIEENPMQPRLNFDLDKLEELSNSIKEHGIIQPITVREIRKGHYQLISGERRLKAVKLACFEKIPVYIRTADDEQLLEMALVENIQRHNLNSIEVALSYERLIFECGLKQEELARKVGKKRSTVNNYLRLLKLPMDVQIALKENKISMGHARALINIENINTQLYILKKILNEGLSVRKVEELASPKKITSTNEKPIELLEFKKYIQTIKKYLNKTVFADISIKSSDGNKGEIKIPFNTKDQLSQLTKKLILADEKS